MRLRLKYVLPFVQMALATWMFRYAAVWTREAERRLETKVGPGPTWYLAFFINEPASILRITWFNFVVDYLWDCVLLVSVTGLFWYWIAMSIESWRTRRELFLFKSLPLRAVADLLLVALGILLGFANANEASRGSFIPLTAQSWWIYVVLFFQVFWPIALVLFPGYDLIRSFRRDYVQRRKLSRATVPPLT